MATTYLKGSSGDTLQWQGNLTVDGTQVFTGGTSYAGDVTLGDAVADSAILKGRLATSTAAGAALAIDATTYQYSNGSYLRYNVADWADTYTLTEFGGMYLRAETNEANASGTLLGATVYGVANNVGVQHLKGVLSYAYIKGATAKTVATAYGLHAELTWDAGAAATTISTEMSPLLAKITGGAANDYTKIHGMIIRSGDMDGQSRTYGNGILIQDDADMSGTITWTTGINITSPFTTGINVNPSAGTTGISVGKASVTLTTGLALGVTSGTLTTGLSFTGTVTTGISFGSTTTNAVDFSSVTTSTNTDGCLIKAGTLAAPVAMNTADQFGIKMFGSSTATTGTLTFARLRAMSNAASGTPGVIGVLAQGSVIASKYVGQMVGLRAEAIAKDSGTVGNEAFAIYAKVEDEGATAGTGSAPTYSSDVAAIGVYSQICANPSGVFSAMFFDNHSIAGAVGASQSWDAVFYFKSEGQTDTTASLIKTGATIATLGSTSTNWISSGNLTDSGAASVACDARIRVDIGGTSYWIPLFDTAA